MRADLSRDTFDPQKPHEAVILQQGRPLLDADFNEQAALTRHRAQATARDVVGRTGAPRDGGGFAIGVSADAKDLTISAGRIYVDGTAVDHLPQRVRARRQSNTALTVDTPLLDGRLLGVGDVVEVSGGAAPMTGTVTGVGGDVVTLSDPHGVPAGADGWLWRGARLSIQPYSVRPAAEATLDGTTATSGRYAVVLHGRTLGFSAIDDPGMAEPALGGPDPSTRLRMVWRVSLARIGNTGTGDCATWQPPARTATLRPVLKQPTTVTTDCALPPEAGFRGVSNSLYRFEVADVNPDGTIKSLLWDPDNGSVASPMSPPTGSTVVLASFGPRGPRGFAKGQTVTTEDQHSEFAGTPARVATISDADPATLTVTLSSAPGVTGPAPRLRRWGGVISPVPAATEVEVELGLWVSVTGTAPVGAYWLLPARTFLGGPGGLDWPAGAQAGTWEALPPRGPAEVWSTLALVDFDGSGFSLVPDPQCRTEFPSLTTITAGDVSYDNSVVDLDADTVQKALEALGSRGGGCTIVVKPGDNWAAEILALPAGADARLCFTSGDFVSTGRVDVSGKGHLVVEGIGPGSRVRATDDEVALAFTGCASVTVRDLSFAAKTTARPNGDGLGGALTIRGSAIAVVERVLASCTSASRPLGGCITVAGTGDTGLTRPDASEAYPGRVVIRDCTLNVGEYQVGLSVRDARDVDISGVIVQGPASGPKKIAELNADLRAQLRAGVIAAMVAVPAGATNIGNTKFTSVGGMREIPYQGMVMQTPGWLAEAWRATLAHLAPDAGRSPKAFLLDLADEALRSTAPDRVGRLRAAIDVALGDRVPPIWQGIVVAGSALGRVTVNDCRVSQAIQGIHISASRSEPSRGAPVLADRVQVAGNTVAITLPPEHARGRHGIYVGNARSVRVAANTTSLSTQVFRDVVDSRGIEVSGYLGSDVVIAENSTFRFPIGIGFLPFGDPSIPLPQVRWLISSNLCSEAMTKAVETAYVRTTMAAIVRDNVP